MYHSLIIGGYNTYDEWHLVPSERPTIPPPPVKTQYTELGGIDGSLDFSEILNGIHYENRTGSIEFWAIDNEMASDGTWQTLYHDILKKIHGKRNRVILEDDPHYYYEGRFSVTSIKTEKNYVSVTIEFTLNPRRYYINDIDQMEWDMDLSNPKYYDAFYIDDTGETKTYNNDTGNTLSMYIKTDGNVVITKPDGTTQTAYANIMTHCSVPTGESTWGFNKNTNLSFVNITLDFTPGEAYL